MQSGAQLHSLFVTILIHGPPAEPRRLWDEFCNHLSDDCAHQLRQHGTTEPSADQITSFALNRIAQLLLGFDKTLGDFNLPSPAFDMDELEGICYITEQLAFDADTLRQETDRDIQTLNAEQLDVYREVMRSCDLGDGRMFFVDGPDGTGKTYRKPHADIGPWSKENCPCSRILRHRSVAVERETYGAVEAQDSHRLEALRGLRDQQAKRPCGDDPTYDAHSVGEVGEHLVKPE